MSTNSPAPRDKALQALFTQTSPIPPAETYDTFAIENPAITATNIPTLLAHMGLGFLVGYINQGDTYRIFCEKQPNHLMYEYECQDLLTERSKVAEEDDYGVGSDDDVDEHMADWTRNDTRAKPVLLENMNIDVSINNVTTGMIIVFNENTGLYQLDYIFIQTPSSPLISLDCTQANSATLRHYMAAFSAVAKKIEQVRDVSAVDANNLRGFYKLTGKPAGPAPV